MRVTDSPHFVGLTLHGAPSRVTSEPALGRGNGEEEQEASGPASRRVSPSTRSRPVGGGDASSVKVGAWVRARLCLSPAAIRVPPPLAAGVRCGAARSDPLAGAACWGRGWRSGRRCVKTNEQRACHSFAPERDGDAARCPCPRPGDAASRPGRRGGGRPRTGVSSRPRFRKGSSGKCSGHGAADSRVRLASRAALARKPGRLGGAGSRRSRGRARTQRRGPAGSAGASRALVTAPISCCRKRIGNAVLTFALGKES